MRALDRLLWLAHWMSESVGGWGGEMIERGESEKERARARE